MSETTPRRRLPEADGPAPRPVAGVPTPVPTTGVLRRVHPVLALTLALLLAGCGGDRGADGADPGSDAGSSAAASTTASSFDFQLERGPDEPLSEDTRAALEEVRAAVEPWRSPERALRDGYVLFAAPPSGRRVAYIDSAAVGEGGASALDQALEPTRPEILIYRRVDAAGDGDGVEGGGAGSTAGARPAGGASAWRLAAVEYALPKTEAGSTRPDGALELFPGIRSGDWREYPTREALGLNVKFTGYGGCHYEGGAELVLVEGPGHTYLRLPPGAVTGESWDGPPVGPEACPDTRQGQDLLVAHARLWMLRAWIGYENPDGVFRPTNSRMEG